MASRLIKESALERNSSGSRTLSVWKGRSVITAATKWVPSCCVAQNCVLDHVLAAYAHTSVTRRGGERVAERPWRDDQLISRVSLLNS